MNPAFKEPQKRNIFYSYLIGERLYQLRNRTEESVETVAAAVGMSTNTIQRAEEGDLSITPSLLSRICAHYGVTMAALLDYRLSS